MFRVYCGNLSPAVNEETLRDLFEEHDIEIAGNVLVKRNYAFVDCPDQENVDKAIDKLNQYNLLGSVMQVEPSNSRRRRPSNKIQIRNLPSHVTREETESLVSPFGNVVKCEQVGAEALVYVTFETPEQAQQAVAGLNGFEFQDRMLKVDFANNRPPMNNNNRRRMNGQNQQQNRQPEFPMRMLVGSEFVGAVIGRQGQTIHGITTQTRARVDIHKREHLSSDTLAMKKQDVNLLKQLIHISDVIQTICQKQHTPSPDSAVDESPTETFHKTKRAPLVRQQSVPYYITVLRAQSSSFNSSFEGINEIPEDETDSCSNDDSDSLLSVSMNGSYSTVPLYIQRANRPRSLSYEEPVGGTSHGSIVGLDDSFFESVLQKNIALWKSETQSDKTKLYSGKNVIGT